MRALDRGKTVRDRHREWVSECAASAWSLIRETTKIRNWAEKKLRRRTNGRRRWDQTLHRSANFRRFLSTVGELRGIFGDLLDGQTPPLSVTVIEDGHDDPRCVERHRGTKPRPSLLSPCIQSGFSRASCFGGLRSPMDVWFRSLLGSFITRRKDFERFLGGMSCDTWAIGLLPHIYVFKVL